MPEPIKLDDFMDWIAERSPEQTEFHQTVHEVVQSVLPCVNDNPDYLRARILYRLVEPDRIVSFRVAWADDRNDVQVNRGYRVQFCNAIGPYKGGLRFHSSVTESILKFLGFEQIFKNALTGLPMGGAKGGSDFDPRGRSSGEIMRFCQSFMTELYRHIGPDVDVPAGDIGVGEAEIGYLFGQYKRITGHFNGTLTGKGLEFGGSCMRPEATGYGAVYFLEDMLHSRDDAIEGRSVVVSGAGNVATHAAEKILHRGGKVLTLSDSGGFLHDEDGLTEEKIAWVRKHKARHGASLADYVGEFGGEWHEDKKPWGVDCDVALPCATQDELGQEDAKRLANNGCIAVVEGANRPLTIDAFQVVKDADVLFGPGKAANAGGVAMSGLEMSQNSARLSRSAEDLRTALRQIMRDIHNTCAEHGEGKQGVDYAKGANVAGFRKVADALLAFGVV
ncbi:NADP-specific glutamate dehydrogenase [Algihabitans albus]|uniref:NADP-specific glutamate dehydrogenase n=1 Tax=Algihabitans albus TaxID=2164067 RepID=UPI000E5CCC34|nr:NADP-specific glutamate dehydrogenase [Algihabitans albus]